MPLHLSRGLAAAVLVVAAGCMFAEDEGVEPMADIATPRQAAPNGLDQLEPAAALDAVMRALQAEGSFRVAGTLMAGGVIDITYLVGTGAVGTVGESADDSSPVKMIVSDGRIYVTGDEEFLTETVGEDAGGTIAGKWLLLAEDSTEQFEVLADGRRFAEAVLGRTDEEVEMTGVREVDGVPAIGLMFQETKATLWVAAHGEPIPLRLEEKGATGDAGVIMFADIGAEVELDVPDDDDVVDLEQLSADQDE